jgi:transcriptional regulator
MYIPPPFAVAELAELHAAIERYSFATLVSRGSDELVASHLPLLLDRSAGTQGTLWGHFARANPQWQQAVADFDSRPEVLVVFSGPHAYISPTWYQTERTVPTWNYVAVHAYGPLEVVDDEPTVLDLLHRTVEHYEAGQPKPWRLADQPAEFIAQLARQIVAFQIPIRRLEGKWKLNQNHPAERRERVAAQLANAASDDEREIASMMRGK